VGCDVHTVVYNETARLHSCLRNPNPNPDPNPNANQDLDPNDFNGAFLVQKYIGDIIFM